MQRRRKGEFGGEVSDPQRAADNLLRRDRLLAERVRGEAEAHDLALIEVTGSDGVDILADRIGRHFTGA